MKTIQGYQFEGPFTTTSTIKKSSGVYVILCDETTIDVGESDDLKYRLDNHDREDCWNEKCKYGTN